MKKRILALLTVLVLITSLCMTTAMAAKRNPPTARLLNTKSEMTVKAGKTITFNFKLNSGLYTKSGKAFRAKMDTAISMKDDEKTLGVATWQFTGKQNYSLSTKVKKNAVKGTYTLSYTTYFRNKGTDSWQKGIAKSADFTVK